MEVDVDRGGKNSIHRAHNVAAARDSGERAEEGECNFKDFLARAYIHT